jgi:hypothetical protein
VPTQSKTAGWSAKAPSTLQTKFASFSLHQYAVGDTWSFATGSGLGVRTGRRILVRQHCHNIEVTRWLCKATGRGRDHAQASMLRWNMWSFIASLKLPPLYPDTGFPRRPNLKNPCREYQDLSQASEPRGPWNSLVTHGTQRLDCRVTLMSVKQPEFTQIFRTNKKLVDFALHFTYTSLLLTYTNTKFQPKLLKNNWNLVCKFFPCKLPQPARVFQLTRTSTGRRREPPFPQTLPLSWHVNDNAEW